MTWRAFTSILSAVGPTLNAAIGGPLASSAVRTMVSVLTVECTADDLERQKDAIAKAFLGTPEQLQQLKDAEECFGKQMHALGFSNAESLAKLVNEERDSSGQAKDWTAQFLAVSVTIGFFGLLWAASYHEVPEGNRQMVDIMIGALGTAWVGIITYYFGSSAGADHKSDLLAKRSSVS